MVPQNHSGLTRKNWLATRLDIFTDQKIINFSFGVYVDDFKPASVDTTKPAELTVGPKDEITVTVPHIQVLYIFLGLSEYMHPLSTTSNGSQPHD